MWQDITEEPGSIDSVVAASMLGAGPSLSLCHKPDRQDSCKQDPVFGNLGLICRAGLFRVMEGGGGATGEPLAKTTQILVLA